MFAFMKFFDCLVKFWTLLYGPKVQWSNSQKATLIGFFQGQFWDPYKCICTFYLAYFISHYQFMRVVPFHCRTVLDVLSLWKEKILLTDLSTARICSHIIQQRHFASPCFIETRVLIKPLYGSMRALISLFLLIWTPACKINYSR